MASDQCMLAVGVLGFNCVLDTAICDILNDPLQNFEICCITTYRTRTNDPRVLIFLALRWNKI